MWLYAAAIAGYIGIIACSSFLGWSSPVLPLYKQNDSPVRINDDEVGWIASAFLLGCAIGPLMSLAVAHVAGRKTLLIATAVPWMVGWTMIIFAASAWELMLSRFIAGTGTGVAFAVLPMYLGEISPPKIRGILLTIIVAACRIGILFGYSLYPFVSIKMSALISMSLPLLFVCCFVWLPESPYYWVRCGRREDAAKSLERFRGTMDIQAELNLIETSVKTEMAKSGGLREILFDPANRKSLSMGVILALFQQLSGSQAIALYAQTIFDLADVDFEGKYATIILGVVQVVSTGLCAAVVDHYGRRPLLLFSTIGSLIATSVVATYFTLRYVNVNTSSIEWLPSSGCMVYVVFYSLGLGPLPTAMVGELYPTNIKPFGCAIVGFVANLTSFVVGKTYMLISASVGTHVAFWIFTGCSVINIIYIYLYIPETKGKTLQEIQEEFGKKKCDIIKGS